MQFLSLQFALWIPALSCFLWSFWSDEAQFQAVHGALWQTGPEGQEQQVRHFNLSRRKPEFLSQTYQQVITNLSLRNCTGSLQPSTCPGHDFPLHIIDISSVPGFRLDWRKNFNDSEDVWASWRPFHSFSQRTPTLPPGQFANLSGTRRYWLSEFMGVKIIGLNMLNPRWHGISKPTMYFLDTGFEHCSSGGHYDSVWKGKGKPLALRFELKLKALTKSFWDPFTCFFVLAVFLNVCDTRFLRGIEVLNLKYNDQRLCCSMLVDLALREKFGNVASVEGSGLLWTSRVWKGEVRCPCNDCYHAWRNGSWMTCMFETVVQEEVTCSRLSQVGEDELLMSYKTSWNILWSKRLQSSRGRISWDDTPCSHSESASLMSRVRKNVLQTQENYGELQ